MNALALRKPHASSLAALLCAILRPACDESPGHSAPLQQACETAHAPAHVCALWRRLQGNGLPEAAGTHTTADSSTGTFRWPTNMLQMSSRMMDPVCCNMIGPASAISLMGCAWRGMHGVEGGVPWARAYGCCDALQARSANLLASNSVSAIVYPASATSPATSGRQAAS